MSTVSATVSGQTVKYVQVWPENGPRQGGAVRSRAEQCGVGVTVWWCERKGTGVKKGGFCEASERQTERRQVGALGSKIKGGWEGKLKTGGSVNPVLRSRVCRRARS